MMKSAKEQPKGSVEESKRRSALVHQKLSELGLPITGNWWEDYWTLHQKIPFIIHPDIKSADDLKVCGAFGIELDQIT